MQPYDDLIKTMRHCVATMNCVTCPVDSIDKTAKAQQRCVTLMLAQAADAIEELSAYAELYQDLAEKNQQTARKVLDAYPRWISVEDALPEVGEGVIVTDGKKSGYGWIIELAGGSRVFATPYDDLPNSETYYFNHWMPLPEPPKEGT